MRYIVKVSCLCALMIGGAFAQGDRGTITGTVIDSSGAVVPRARVVAENADTHNILETVTTNTGNYTLVQVPAGVWDVAVEATGFKKFTSLKNTVEVAQTLRVDVKLEIGANTESITVQAEAVAIKTEDADVTTTVSNDMFVELPIQWSNGFYGNQAVRNPLSVAQILPGMSGGTSYFGSFGLTGGGASINGSVPGTFKTMVDGQDATNLYAPGFFFYQQPSVEALEEVSLQTSNFAAEFGQAQGGIYNFTAKSGTNQYHGGLFYRFTNEDLNAHQPYTGSRAKSRQNNFGGTFGGPVRIPKIYNGKNKTFFFFSMEGFRSVLPVPNSGTFTTVPNATDRVGNFAADIGSQVTCGGGPCKDALGNAVYAGEIFDPLDLASDGFTRMPFTNNSIPSSRIDPVAFKIQGLLPQDNQRSSGAELSTVRHHSSPAESAIDQGRSQLLARPQTLDALLLCRRLRSDEHGRSAFEHHHCRLQSQCVQHGARKCGRHAAALAAAARGRGIREHAGPEAFLPGGGSFRSEPDRTHRYHLPRLPADHRRGQYLREWRTHRRHDGEFRIELQPIREYGRIQQFDDARMGQRFAFV